MAGVTLVNLTIVATAFIVYSIVTRIIRNRQVKAFAKEHGCEEPLDQSGPFPYGWSTLRRLANADANGEDILDDILTEVFRSATTVKRTLFDGTEALETVEPANLQAMLATQFKDFETGARRRNVLFPVLGNSIFSSDGEFWEHSRALFRPQFSRDNINDLEETSRACDCLIEATGAIDHAGWTSTVALQPLLFNFTIDTASAFLFGECLEAQQAGVNAAKGNVSTAAQTASSEGFLNALEKGNKTLEMRFRLQSLYWLADSFSFRRATNDLKQITEHFVQRAIEKSSDMPGKENNLLSSLVHQTKDKEELRNQTLAILFAGRDTTASLLGWCFTRLALHKDAFETLRGAIMRDFIPGEEITFAKLKACRPLQHFINETLRLHPTVPLNMRFATRDTTLPSGGGPQGQAPIVVRKGQGIMFSVHIMHRRKDLWGEDALDFKPERWQTRVPAWQYLPFLGGPRICLGQQFALIETSYVLVRMLQQFDAVEPVDRQGMARFKKAVGITCWPADGVKVRLRKAA